jgi:hypothetical protein
MGGASAYTAHALYKHALYNNRGLSSQYRIILFSSFQKECDPCGPIPKEFNSVAP